MGRLAFRNARESRDTTQAELLAESILAKVQLGIIEMETAVDVPITNQTEYNDTIEDTAVITEGDANDVKWMYSIDVNNVDESENLIEIGITVTQNPQQTNQPIRCYIVRWLVIESDEEE
jgi:hypothetical protein